MIAVNVNAGLANQMFHYAFGRGLMAKGLDVCFDQSNFKPRSQWAFELVRLQDAFPSIDIKLMPEGHFKWVFPSLPRNGLERRFQEFMKKWHNFIGDEVYIDEPMYGYVPDMEKCATRNCIYKGFWQSEKYFRHCEDDIRKQFTFLPFDELKNIEVAAKMSQENSVAIHLRKGDDYMQSELMGKGLCTVEYYMKAIDYMRKHINNPHFYVFTDNPCWVKDNLPEFEYMLVDWNEVSGKRNFRDMQLMSCAKHNIIGNSTYSWWAAWLNANQDKIVVGPKRFFNPINSFFSTCDIMCEDWISL